MFILLITENTTAMPHVHIVGAVNVCYEPAVWRDLEVTLAEGTYGT